MYPHVKTIETTQVIRSFFLYGVLLVEWAFFFSAFQALKKYKKYHSPRKHSEKASTQQVEILHLPNQG